VLKFLAGDGGDRNGASGISAFPLPPGVSAGPSLPTMPPVSAGMETAPRDSVRANASTPPRDFDAHGERRVTMSKIRQAIAATLVRAQQTAAILTTFNEVDMSAILELRSRFKERFSEVHGVGLGFMSFFARAVVSGLREFPRLNAYLDGNDVVYHQHVNLGVAVSTDRGLAVPVLRNMEAMSFATIESEIKRLAAATRDGKLGVDEVSGGTFTITNGGIFGSLLSTPIINPPQSGILGMHAIQKRPVVIDDAIVIRPMMYLALSYDHRLVDGKEAISFLVRVKQCLEDPTRLMLEV
jgi:2-oxoglutarate dehydrogenase E2 component (dihydrolipoamide succinyltransferase)